MTSNLATVIRECLNPDLLTAGALHRADERGDSRQGALISYDRINEFVDCEDIAAFFRRNLLVDSLHESLFKVAA